MHIKSIHNHQNKHANSCTICKTFEQPPEEGRSAETASLLLRKKHTPRVTCSGLHSPKLLEQCPLAPSFSCLYHFPKWMQILPWERVLTCSSSALPEGLACSSARGPALSPTVCVSASLQSRKHCGWSPCCLCCPALAESLPEINWLIYGLGR